MKILIELFKWFFTIQFFRYDLECLDKVIFCWGIGSLHPGGKRLTIRWTVSDGDGKLRWQVGREVYEFTAPIRRVQA